MPRSNVVSHPFAFVLLLVSGAAFAAAQQTHTDAPVTTPQTFALADTKDLAETGGVRAEAVEYMGRKAVRLTTPGGDAAGFTLLKGTNFRDGIIEVDIAAKITTPPGVRMPGFTGIAFRSRPDGSQYELFYLRPGNARADDQAMRNHTVQYTSEPAFGWEKLRRNWPFIYESYADITVDEWTKIKIEVHGRRAVLYLNGSENPSLIVDGLKGQDLQGAVALWSYSGEEAYFSNLKITPAKAEAIENGGDVAGMWNVTCATDAGRLTGTLKLVRQDNTIVGLWSGGMGADQQVSGVWRDGYVEFSFGGTWRDQPGTVTATFDGWVDGDSTKGRMKVGGRAMGRWTAERKK